MSYPPQSAPPQQYPPQDQVPTPMQHAPAPMKKGRNTVGIVALVMAVIGFIFACLPGALIVGWILLPISFIVGLVGLFRRGEAVWPAVTAVIVSVVGTIVGVMVFLTVLSNVVDDAVNSASAVTASVAPGGKSSDAGGSGSADSSQGKTRENPYLDLSLVG